MRVRFDSVGRCHSILTGLERLFIGVRPDWAGWWDEGQADKLRLAVELAHLDARHDPEVVQENLEWIAERMHRPTWVTDFVHAKFRRRRPLKMR
jgi:hypothetical protein